MKKILLAAVTILLSILTNAQTPDCLWAQRAGGNQTEEPQSVSVDAIGNTYVSGYFFDSILIFGTDTLVNTPGGSADIFIVKYDTLGNVIWAKGFGSNQFDDGIDIATDAAGDVYFCGTFNGLTITMGSVTLTNAAGLGNTSDLFLMKMDSSGIVLWAKRAGGMENDYGTDLAVDNSGDILMTGIFKSSSITFGATVLGNAGGGSGTSDAFIAKYDSLGSLIWAKSEGGGADDEGRDVTANILGDIFLLGVFNGTSITFGSTTLPNAGVGYNDIFISKYDSLGNIIWAKGIGGSNNEDVRNISMDLLGNILVAGNFNSPTLTIGSTVLTTAGSDDVLVVKYDTSGNIIWAESAGGTLSDRCYGSMVDANNNLIITGFFNSPVLTIGSTALSTVGSYDIFLAKYDFAGNVSWAKSFGGTSIEFVYGIDVCNNNDVLITGSFYSPIIIVGSDSLNNAGGVSGSPDIFLVKISNTSFVWPGDSDENNIADNNDLLPIGLYYGQTGTPRTTISNTWQAYSSSDWGILQTGGADIKHVDCNGDGVIDNNDTLAINLNFSLTHAFAPSINEERMSGSDFYFVTSSSSYLSGSMVDVEVWLGNSTIPVTNLYGIAFDINYDASLVQPSSESLTYPVSWLGTPGTDAIKIAKIDAPANTAYGAETRMDQNNVSGFGKIADFKFQLKSFIPANTVMYFSISGYQANDASGMPVVFNTPIDSIVVNSTVGINEQNNSAQISVYPNPTSGSFSVFTSEQIKNGSIEIYNRIGALVLNQEISGQQNNIDLKNLANGIYFVKVMSEGKIIGMQKVVKE